MTVHPPSREMETHCCSHAAGQAPALSSNPTWLKDAGPNRRSLRSPGSGMISIRQWPRMALTWFSYRLVRCLASRSESRTCGVSIAATEAGERPCTCRKPSILDRGPTRPVSRRTTASISWRSSSPARCNSTEHAGQRVIIKPRNRYHSAARPQPMLIPRLRRTNRCWFSPAPDAARGHESRPSRGAPLPLQGTPRSTGA